jgi:hypothetical protein
MTKRAARMNKRSEDIQSFIGKKLHSLLFLEEFVFSRNKFSPPSPSELEFADAVVMLGNVLFICQIKERSAEQSGDEDAERRWFQSKVRTPDIPPSVSVRFLHHFGVPATAKCMRS